MNDVVRSSPDVIRLDQRVNTLEAGLKQVVEVVGRIDTKLDERGKTNWGLLAAMVGTSLAIVTAIGGLAYSPIKDSLARIETGEKDNNTKIDADERLSRDVFVTKGDFTAVLQAVKEKRDDAQRVAEDRFRRIEADIDTLQKEVVPRGEHERQWADQRRLDDGLRDDIKELRHRLETDYMPKEAMEILTRRLDDLERRFNAKGG